MLDAITRRMQYENLSNVTTVLGTPSDPRLPSAIDAALISDAFHEMDDPSDRSVIVTLLRNVGNALERLGRVEADGDAVGKLVGPFLAKGEE